jgi:hypothetical protein
MNGQQNGQKFNNLPLIPKQGKEEKDQCIIVFLIYQSFDMSLIWVQLIPRITRFIFSQLKNGLCFEFSVLCEHTSFEISTDTRLPKQPHLTRVLMVYFCICS